MVEARRQVVPAGPWIVRGHRARPRVAGRGTAHRNLWRVPHPHRHDRGHGHDDLHAARRTDRHGVAVPAGRHAAHRRGLTMPAVSESKYLVMAGWNDVPHLTEKTKRELLASTPSHLREARSKGIPLLGDGAIFPVDDRLIECDPIAIPPWWKQIVGMDF